MPYPGTANNGLGINSFSGPMGQKEPAYGAIERAKILTAMAPPGTPAAVGAPERSKRAAVRGRRATQRQAAAAPPVEAPPAAPPEQTYSSQVTDFWQQAAADPNASDLVKRLAAEVLSGAAAA